MHDIRWTPPRGAVRVHPDQRRPGSWAVTCDACDMVYPEPQYSSTRTGAEDQKRYHRCPGGTAAAYPTCPDCGATGKRCKADSAYDIPAGPHRQWHMSRAKVYETAITA